MSEGAAWERSSTEILAAVSKKFQRKRMGAKAAKDVERAKHIGGLVVTRAGDQFPIDGGQG